MYEIVFICYLCDLSQHHNKAVSPYGHSYLVQTVRCWLDGSSTDRSFLLAMPKRPLTNRVESNCIERVPLRARCAFNALCFGWRHLWMTLKFTNTSKHLQLRDTNLSHCFLPEITPRIWKKMLTCNFDSLYGRLCKKWFWKFILCLGNGFKVKRGVNGFVFLYKVSLYIYPCFFSKTKWSIAEHTYLSTFS